MKESTPERDVKQLRALEAELNTCVAGAYKGSAHQQWLQDRIGELGTAYMMKLAGLNPRDPDAVGELGRLQLEIKVLTDLERGQWLLSRPVQALTAAINRAKELISITAAHKHPAEATIGLCTFYNMLDGLAGKPLSTQLSILQDAGREALSGLRVVLAERRPIILRQDERRNGVMCKGSTEEPARKLTIQEVIDGVVHE